MIPEFKPLFESAPSEGVVPEDSVEGLAHFFTMVGEEETIRAGYDLDRLMREAGKNAYQRTRRLGRLVASVRATPWAHHILPRIEGSYFGRCTLWRWSRPDYDPRGQRWTPDAHGRAWEQGLADWVPPLVSPIHVPADGDAALLAAQWIWYPTSLVPEIVNDERARRSREGREESFVFPVSRVAARGSRLIRRG